MTDKGERGIKYQLIEVTLSFEIGSCVCALISFLSQQFQVFWSQEAP